MLEGGDQVTRMEPLTAVALGLVTAPGFVIGAVGVTAALALEGEDVPAELVAVAVKV